MLSIQELPVLIFTGEAEYVNQEEWVILHSEVENGHSTKHRFTSSQSKDQAA